MGLGWTGTASIRQTPIEESGYIGNLRLIEPDGRHAFTGPAVANHRPYQIAAFIVADECGTKQIGSFARPGRIGAVAKGAGLRKLYLASFGRVRLRRHILGGNRRLRGKDERKGDKGPRTDQSRLSVRMTQVVARKRGKRPASTQEA